MADNHRKEYEEIANKFSKSKSSAEEVNKLYEIIDELEKEEEKDYSLLATIYSELQYYQKAYDCFLKIAKKNNKKDRKKLFELKGKADSYGDRLSIQKKDKVTKSFIGKIPKFKYCPDVIGTNIFTVGGLETCDCCGENVDVYYEGSFYTTEDVDCLCPECISSGLAAEKFDGEFQQDIFNDENVTNEDYKDEILHRTPSYISWQGSNWPAHCDDYCEFLGDAGWDILKKIGIENDFENYTGFSYEDLKEYLAPNGSICGYLFRCLKCGKYCLCADCD